MSHEFNLNIAAINLWECPWCTVNDLLIVKNIHVSIHCTATVPQLTHEVSKMAKLGFAYSIDPDEVAYNEPPHLNLHCLLSSL